MVKPRHHTLQGICQDVCVSYQSVVEVHRRIREVVLSENGKVITHNLGTFFCRDVKPRGGMLNGVAWTTDGFFEVGLKGERTERSDAHDVGTVTRVSFSVGTGNLAPGLLGDLFSTPGIASLDFQEDSSIVATRFLGPPNLLGPRFRTSTIEVSAEGLSPGFNNVELEIRADDNNNDFPFLVVDRLEPLGPVMIVDGMPLGLGDRVELDVSKPVIFDYQVDGLDLSRRPSSWAFRLSYTFFDQNDV